ncbi:class I SAM-dependent methyltransferase [Antrihabitans sp. NCIMB 15449]|uniref:Class I SAM-dependent methyltransferase n=1 Tax=Antrihabitans spumae TaxID=3373370 RepID=A0ABW7JMD2_9NOCA
MDAKDWDDRYAQADLVWGAPPNSLVVQQVWPLQRGRALDLACGEGRNAIWLAVTGWRVTAVDFSRVALDKGATVAARSPRSVRERIEWVRADVTDAQFDSDYDLVLLVFLHLPADERAAVLTASIDALTPGGTLIVLGHDSDNITSGVGGPQDPAILFTPDDVVAELGTRADIRVAERRLRETPAGDAIDALVVATKL